MERSYLEKQTITDKQDFIDILKPFGLRPIVLDLPFRLDHVNCFIAEGENGWTVIDTGLHNQETVKRWEAELAGKTISDIIITHNHPDHFGYAGGMQEKTGAHVSMTKMDYDEAVNTWNKNYLSKLTAYYKQAGIPDEIGRKMQGNTAEFIDRVTPYPEVGHYFQEGEIVPIGNNEYQVIFTPGHADGLVTFYNQAHNMLLSTDHILPKITPNISYWFRGDPDPLASYLRSLEKVKKLDADLVVPSHGTPFHGANDRIAAIQAHHEERLAQTLEIIGSGVTVYEACAKLFRKELTIHETRFAIGETIAHLEYLKNKGECRREEKAGEYCYYI